MGSFCLSIKEFKKESVRRVWFYAAFSNIPAISQQGKYNQKPALQTVPMWGIKPRS